ncbi:MAG: hydroxyacylglutathione hydrolase [Proteobacteria bacterium]|nr:MAG: hydroxyacylglutathione hydrolase [Pseudomonadota bacterium]
MREFLLTTVPSSAAPNRRLSTGRVEVITVRALQDNYCYLVRRTGSLKALVIDTSDFEPIQKQLQAEDLELHLILNTHHHGDHVAANTQLVQHWKCPVYCSTVDVARVPLAKRGLEDGEVFEFDGIKIQTLSIPGHTRGQIAFHLPDENLVFVGDTLFAMGCGRLLEGMPEQMLSSLRRLMDLPRETRVFFGHEYTEKNGTFARDVEPDNKCVLDRMRAAREALSVGGVSHAPTLAEEMKANPFLRLNSPSLRRQLNMVNETELEVFTSLRRLRDVFQG